MEIINRSDEISGIEYGHWQPGEDGADGPVWKSGSYMVTLAMDDVCNQLPKQLEQQIGRLLKKTLKGA